MISNLPSNAKDYLLEIFNDVILRGEIIEEWKKLVVVPIPKPNKNFHLANSYHSIYLLFSILKTFERMINNRLEWWMRFHPLLNQQLTFRKGLGTTDALAVIVTLILDLQGAYDQIDLTLLRTKLEMYGLSPHLCYIITYLITIEQFL
ncbi:unnamed protein product [Acanthoscelides obtectus]|uniref:Reverse transcriptase domain-containing protein n=1 Tax=Acanthoscelides obtectus TaxID=200917 RepID=A0A9P0Q8X4_ACAOB|nr:unnamed protein product [Acanthoscelides obtectus]CAK1641246.1 Probable RNA-directed DNA polymerase from transposon X-element [Acanthoscelides obtectus]